MDILLFIIIILLASLLIFTIYTHINIKNKKMDTSALDAIAARIAELHQNQHNLSNRIDDKLHESSNKLHESLRYQTSESLKAIRDVTQQLTKLDQTNQQVVSFTEQLQQLQNILKNPKQRGVLGEYYLETLLKNVLPPNTYQMQYTFKDGTIVDAAVLVKDRVIPIDSKFSLENYNRLVDAKERSEQARLEKEFKADLKKRIDETSKYVKPSEGTMDFAFMFIPHEAIYYDLLVAEIGGVKVNTRDLINYAFEKNVLIVSPTSFLAFLQTVLQGLRALQIEDSAKEIRKRVGDLQKHLQSYSMYQQKLGNTLTTTVNHFNKATKEFSKIDKDVTKITGEDTNIEEIDIIEKPIEIDQ